MTTLSYRIQPRNRAPWMTDAIRQGLEAAFQVQPKPSAAIRQDLADKSAATFKQITNWFQNRRAKATRVQELANR